MRVSIFLTILAVLLAVGMLVAFTGPVVGGEMHSVEFTSVVDTGTLSTAASGTDVK